MSAAFTALNNKSLSFGGGTLFLGLGTFHSQNIMCKNLKYSTYKSLIRKE
jgi:hypothetical protein